MAGKIYSRLQDCFTKGMMAVLQPGRPHYLMARIVSACGAYLSGPSAASKRNMRTYFFSVAMSITKRYFTSPFSRRS